MKIKVPVAVLVTIFLLAFLPTAIMAQSVKEETVMLWPQYDKPAVLVMQYVFFNEQKTDASLYLPKTVDKNAILAMSPDKQNRNEQTPKISEEGSNWKVNFPVLYGNAYTEGYFPYQSQGDKKTFSYKFKSTYNIPKLYFEFQQPVKATEFKITPAPVGQKKDKENYNTSLFNYSNVKADQEFEFKVSYTNSAPNNSVYYKQPKTESNTSNNTSSTSGGSINGTVLIAVAIAVVSVIGYSFYSAISKNDKLRTQKLSKSFCTNCGNPLEPSQKFCPKCGRKSQS